MPIYGRVSLKGPTYEAGTRLQAAAGVHHLTSNLWHVLVRLRTSSFVRSRRPILNGVVRVSRQEL